MKRAASSPAGALRRAARPVARFAGIEAVIFDFDGTLFDASEAIFHSFNAALRRHGRNPLPHPDIARMIGRPLVDMFPMVDPGASPEKVQSYIEAYREEFWPICVPLSRPLPGLRACLEALRGRVRMAIATSRTERGARVILQGSGMEKFFDAIVAIEHVARVKPDPEPVLRALALLGTAPAHGMMVGDTPDDMRAARAAGATAVGVTTGYHDATALRLAGAHRVLRSLARLPACLR